MLKKYVFSSSIIGILLFITSLILTGCTVNDVTPRYSPHACRRVVYRTVCRGRRYRRHCRTVRRIRRIC